MLDIVFFIFDGLTALDAVGPFEVLSRIPDVRIRFASVEAGTIRTGDGTLGLEADFAIAEVDSADVLVIPGGPGTRALIEHEGLLQWVKKVHATTTWTTSVCTGALVLGAAGLLQGLNATTHHDATDLLATFGATYVDQRVIFQGKIVTSAGVSSGIDMALALTERLTDADTTARIRKQIEY